MNNLVSIIVPIYNAERYLIECVESILAQTYKNLEIILVNDGSTDNSLKISEGFANQDSRIKIINQKNSGVSTTRNTGIDAANGDYICFSDADDVLEIDYVDYLIQLISNENADISYTSQMFTTYSRKQVKNDIINLYTNEEATLQIFYYKVPIGVYCKMFKREFLNKHKIRFIPSIYIGEGFNFNTECFQRANRVVAGNRRIYFYRRNNLNSAMTKFDIRKCEMAIHAINTIKENLVLKSVKIYKAWEFASWHTHADMYYLIENSKRKKTYYALYKKCKEIAKRKAFIAFTVPTKKSEKIKAVLLFIFPLLVAKLILWRQNKYSKK